MAAERPPQQQTVTATIRDDIRQQRMSTAKNRRLAQQMANRPSVQAALKLKNVRLTDVHTVLFNVPLFIWVLHFLLDLFSNC